MDIMQNERLKICHYLQMLEKTGLGGGGTSGNISIINRAYNLIAISPSGISYTDIKPSQIVIVDREGNTVNSQLRPSSELKFHLEIYNKREDLHSVVHTHSINASAYSTLGKELPAYHYIIGYVGKKVPFIKYSTFGGSELAQEIGKTLENFNGVILGNHGVVAAGDTIDRAYACAEAIEFVCEIYFKIKNLDNVNILNDSQMEIVLEKFKSYGQGKQ